MRDASEDDMQAIKNGIKSVIRTPGKTALFLLISTVLAALLSVALCVMSSVTGYLRDCDDFYRTVVELEYIGAKYPSDNYYDSSAAEAVSEHAEEIQALAGDGSVIFFEPADPAVLIIEGFERKDSMSFDPKAAVLKVKILMQLDDGSYAALIEEQLYSRSPVENKMMLIDGAENVEKGKKYYASGHFFMGPSSYYWFAPCEFELPSEDGAKIVPAFTEYVPEADSGADYTALAERIKTRNDLLRTIRTSSLTDLVPFNQQETVLTEGREFTEDEYRSKARAMIIPDRLADLMGVKAGDRVNAELIETGGDVYSEAKSEDAFEEYEIVGVYKFCDRYPYAVILPDSEAGKRAPGYVTGYRIGTFRLRNDSAEAFMGKTEALASVGFRFTLYDQGYSAATEPMKELRIISYVFLAVCALFIASALALYGHLFVSRQRDSAAAMIALGSGKVHVIKYFISAVCLIAVPSAVAGGFIGRALESRVVGILEDFVRKLSEQDLRYSSSRITVVKTLNFEPKVSAWNYAAAGILIVLAAAAVTLIFSALSLREKKPKKKKQKIRTPKRAARSSRLSGMFKYSLLSIRRNVVRTLAVLLLAAVIAVFFGRLTSSLDGYHAQLAAVRRDSVIKGHASDVTGRMIDGLAIRQHEVANALENELVAKAAITRNLGNVLFTGIQVTKDGEFIDLPEYVLPESGFALETLERNLTAEPKWVMSLSVENSAAFYYFNAKEIEWLEGWSEDDFDPRKEHPTRENVWVIPCAMPVGYMEKNGIELGDTVRFLAGIPLDYSGGDLSVSFEIELLQVVASYVPPTDAQIIFSPIDRIEDYSRRTWSSFTFTLGDNARLDELRQVLEDSGFKYVAPNERSTTIAVIDDEIYLNVTKSMERQIQYVSALYISLYVLAGLVGAVLAWLLISSRRKEIANMRALGTQRLRIVLNFGFEQALLAALGLAAGVLIQYAAGGPPNRMQLILTSAFWGLWCLSTLVSLVSCLSKKTMEALTEPE